jgi:hypothetical protein
MQAGSWLACGRQAACKQAFRLTVDKKQDGQHEAVRNVADRQKTQTFRQEAKQLELLAAARQQEVNIVRWLYREGRLT